MPGDAGQRSGSTGEGTVAQWLVERVVSLSKILSGHRLESSIEKLKRRRPHRNSLGDSIAKGAEILIFDDAVGAWRLA